MEAKPVRTLYRSPNNKMIAGVCGGVADYIALDATLVRILWVISFFIGGAGLVAYLACLILVPVGQERSEKRIRVMDTELIVGVVLVVAGLLLFLNRTFDLFWPWLDWWPFRWRYVWPVLIIFIGIWLIFRSTGAGESIRFGAGRLFRSRSDRMVAGVCGGLAAHWHVDVSVVRVAFVLLTIYTHMVLGFAAYALLLIFLPEKEG